MPTGTPLRCSSRQKSRWIPVREPSVCLDHTGDLQDRLNPFGTRLLAQATAEDSTGVTITRSLAAGTYSIAVSGKGNSYFHPDLADSGLAGETGDYTLEFTSTALMGPVSGDPLPLAIDASPLGVRIDFGGALNFSPAVNHEFTGTAISLSWTNYSSTINELQFAQIGRMTAGDYTAVIKDTTGTVRMTLQVHVPEVADIPADSGDDTPATAIDLGELDALGIIQVPGIIGDDPYYDSSSVARASIRETTSTCITSTSALRRQWDFKPKCLLAGSGRISIPESACIAWIPSPET